MPLSRASWRHAGVVEQPAQRQHRLLVGAQRPGVLAGAPAHPLGVQQPGQEQHAVLGDVQDSGVCDTHGGAEPLYRMIFGRITSCSGSSALLVGPASACRPSAATHSH